MNGPGSDVPELANESFGAVIDATQPIAVERSLYSNVGGVVWAAGTNATATRLSPPQPLTVSVEATDSTASEVDWNTGTFTFTRSGGTSTAALIDLLHDRRHGDNGNDYTATGSSRDDSREPDERDGHHHAVRRQPLRRIGDGDA